ARPVFRLFDRETSLRTHINHDPGNHNFGKDNREALYRLIGAHWFRDTKDYDAREIDVKKEIKKAAELNVELPPDNADFNTLAKAMMKQLPRKGDLPTEKGESWQEEGRKRLAEVLRSRKRVFSDIERSKPDEERRGVVVNYTTILLSEAERKNVWRVPVVLLSPIPPTGTAVLIGDGGRKALHEHAARLLSAGKRVYVVDPFYNGESSVDQRAYLFALMLATVGDRVLGVQAIQLGEVARYEKPTMELVAVGPRASVTALTAAA